MDIIPQDATPMKRCPRCQNIKPATIEFFHRRSTGKDGLQIYCKQCAKEKLRENYHAPAKPVIPEGYKRCIACEELKPATFEYFQKFSPSKSGLRAECKDCRSKQRKQYRLNNLEASREYGRLQAASRKDNPVYRQNDHENRLRYYRQKHPPKIIVKDGMKRCSLCTEWKPATSDYFHSRKGSKHGLRSWCIECRNAHEPDYAWDRERYQALIEHRKEREKNAEGRYTPADIRKQHQRQKGKCYYCSCKLKKYHIDHIVPLTRGGTNWPDNLVVTCPHCNLSKGNKLPHEWYSGGRLM